MPLSVDCTKILCLLISSHAFAFPTAVVNQFSGKDSDAAEIFQKIEDSGLQYLEVSTQYLSGFNHHCDNSFTKHADLSLLCFLGQAIFNHSNAGFRTSLFLLSDQKLQNLKSFKSRSRSVTKAGTLHAEWTSEHVLLQRAALVSHF